MESEDGPLRRMLAALARDESSTDVTFEFPLDGALAPTACAHKAVLAAASPMFASLLSGRWEAGSSRVVLSTISREVFLVLKAWMYCRDASAITVFNALTVRTAANYFLLPGLEAACVRVLFPLTQAVETACRLLTSILTDEALTTALVQPQPPASPAASTRRADRDTISEADPACSIAAAAIGLGGVDSDAESSAGIVSCGSSGRPRSRTNSGASSAKAAGLRTADDSAPGRARLRTSSSCGLTPTLSRHGSFAANGLPGTDGGALDASVHDRHESLALAAAARDEGLLHAASGVHGDLLEQCIVTICFRGSAALASPEFVRLPLDAVLLLLTSDDFCVERGEDEVVEAVLRWTRHNATAACMFTGGSGTSTPARMSRASSVCTDPPSYTVAATHAAPPAAATQSSASIPALDAMALPITCSDACVDTERGSPGGAAALSMSVAPASRSPPLALHPQQARRAGDAADAGAAVEQRRMPPPARPPVASAGAAAARKAPPPLRKTASASGVVPVRHIVGTAAAIQGRHSISAAVSSPLEAVAASLAATGSDARGVRLPVAATAIAELAAGSNVTIGSSVVSSSASRRSSVASVLGAAVAVGAGRATASPSYSHTAAGDACETMRRTLSNSSLATPEQLLFQRVASVIRWERVPVAVITRDIGAAGALPARDFAELMAFRLAQAGDPAGGGGARAADVSDSTVVSSGSPPTASADTHAATTTAGSGRKPSVVARVRHRSSRLISGISSGASTMFAAISSLVGAADGATLDKAARRRSAGAGDPAAARHPPVSGTLRTPPARSPVHSSSPADIGAVAFEGADDGARMILFDSPMHSGDAASFRLSPLAARSRTGTACSDSEFASGAGAGDGDAATSAAVLLDGRASPTWYAWLPAPPRARLRMLPLRLSWHYNFRAPHALDGVPAESDTEVLALPESPYRLMRGSGPADGFRGHQLGIWDPAHPNADPTPIPSMELSSVRWSFEVRAAAADACFCFGFCIQGGPDVEAVTRYGLMSNGKLCAAAPVNADESAVTGAWTAPAIGLHRLGTGDVVTFLFRASDSSVAADVNGVRVARFTCPAFWMFPLCYTFNDRFARLALTGYEAILHDADGDA